MQKIKDLIINSVVKFLYAVAYRSVNSVSLAGMYELECPESLKIK